MLIIFDLDGVLYDSKDMHYRALNEALVKYGQKPISYHDHLSNFDALPTKIKLEKLGIEQTLAEDINVLKQLITQAEISNFNKDYALIDMLQKLKSYGHTLAVASNSKRSTTHLALSRLGIADEFAYVVSAEDVSRPKPYPAMYWKCMDKLGFTAIDTLVIEDSQIGRQTILHSGIWEYLMVTNRQDLTLRKILEAIDFD